MNHQRPGCKRHGLKSTMHTKPSEPDELATTDRDCGPLSPELATPITNVQTTVLMSFDGTLDRKIGSSMASQVRGLLDLGIRSIFLDLSGVDAVEVSGVQHLVETLDYANALGGGVAVLKGSEALAPYLWKM
jgi:anti-anti-sigma regulatory factor